MTAQDMPPALAQAAGIVLGTADPRQKSAASRRVADAWRTGTIGTVGTADPPRRPARPAKPELRPPRDMPKRGKAMARDGRVALLHALAHIELNAIDLAWDLIARFTGEDPPRAFYDDWVRVADEEAGHFTKICDRLADFGTAYGDLPAHDGLWEAAEETAHDLSARLAVVPLVLEARGLDVTPPMIHRLRAAGDETSARVLEVIYRDEIGHVAIGMRWFRWSCARRGAAPDETWRRLVARHFRGTLKPPFNDAARAAAGFAESLYKTV